LNAAKGEELGSGKNLQSFGKSVVEVWMRTISCWPWRQCWRDLHWVTHWWPTLYMVYIQIYKQAFQTLAMHSLGALFCFSFWLRVLD